MILVVGRHPHLTERLIGGLTYEGVRVRHIVHGDRVRKLQADRYEADLMSLESLGRLRALLLSSGAEVGGVINFLGAGADALSPSEMDGEVHRATLGSFNVIKTFHDDLVSAADAGTGFVLNVTAIDGRFGLLDEGGDEGGFSVEGAGTVGLCKALKRELTRLNVRNVDVDPTADPQVVVGRLFEELQAADDSLEVGLDEGGRWVLTLGSNGVEERPEGAAGVGSLLSKDAVVLATGGAYGITAEVMKGLAREAPCHLILLGRSPWPDDEDPELAGLDRSGLRSHFIERLRSGDEGLTPAEIEARVRRILKDRAMRENVRAMRDAGARVAYHSVDVGDDEAFGALVDELYERHARIDGVLHGAGVIEDKLIRDKTVDSFERVFRTKVDAALTLARRLRPDTLRFVVFFSSVSARFGNAGQADYAAANETLNKLARRLDRAWPARVVSINWGPWDAGMVSDDLRRMYAERGIGLISIGDGVRACLAEIARSDEEHAAEVTVACGLSRMIGEAAEGAVR